MCVLSLSLNTNNGWIATTFNTNVKGPKETNPDYYIIVSLSLDFSCFTIQRLMFFLMADTYLITPSLYDTIRFDIFKLKQFQNQGPTVQTFPWCHNPLTLYSPGLKSHEGISGRSAGRCLWAGFWHTAPEKSIWVKFRMRYRRCHYLVMALPWHCHDIGECLYDLDIVTWFHWCWQWFRDLLPGYLLSTDKNTCDENM